MKCNVFFFFICKRDLMWCTLLLIKVGMRNKMWYSFMTKLNIGMKMRYTNSLLIIKVGKDENITVI